MFYGTLKKQWGLLLFCVKTVVIVMQFELAHLKKQKEEEVNILPFGRFYGLADAEFEITARHH